MRMRLLSTLAAAGMVVAVAAGPVEAGSVQYSTVGTFSASSSSTWTVGGSTLSFTGVTNQTYTTPLNIVIDALFGQFALTTTTTPPSTDTFSGNFAIDVTQIFPSPTGGSPATVTYSVMGEVNTDPTSGALIVAFPAAAFSINTAYGDYDYLLDDFITVSPGGTRDLAGVIVMPAGAPVIPLPPAVLAGGLLIGLMGAGRIRRRMAA